MFNNYMKVINLIFKENINYKDFFSKVNMCIDDVWLLTNKGYELNLKSVLYQYVFIVLNGDVGLSGIVYCDEASDYKYIYEYLK